MTEVEKAQEAHDSANRALIAAIKGYGRLTVKQAELIEQKAHTELKIAKWQAWKNQDYITKLVAGGLV